MTYTKITRTFVATMALGFAALIGGQANASDYRHLDDLSLEIQRATKQLSREVVHYRHTPEYRHLRDDTRQLRRLARHIHTLTRRDGNLHHIRQDLAELDRTFHHIENVFDRVEAASSCGVGHVRGNTAHVKFLLRSIGRTIHHMQADVRALTRPVCGTRRYSGRYDSYSSGQFRGGYPTGVTRGGQGRHFDDFSQAYNPRRGVQIDRHGMNLGTGSLGFRINF